MKFFADCKTLDEVKATYRTLAKEHHPDRGGNLETMQTVNKEYAFACAHIAKGSDWTAEEVDAAILNAEEYRKAIEKIVHLEGIDIELIGAWIWVSGNTRPHSDYLKSDQNGPRFWWAKKKLMWYFRGTEFRVNTRGRSMDIDAIRGKYGTMKIHSKADDKKLA